jgi:hypothetical protein
MNASAKIAKPPSYPKLVLPHVNPNALNALCRTLVDPSPKIVSLYSLFQLGLSNERLNDFLLARGEFISLMVYKQGTGFLLWRKDCEPHPPNGDGDFPEIFMPAEWRETFAQGLANKFANYGLVNTSTIPGLLCPNPFNEIYMGEISDNTRQNFSKCIKSKMFLDLLVKAGCPADGGADYYKRARVREPAKNERLIYRGKRKKEVILSIYGEYTGKTQQKFKRDYMDKGRYFFSHDRRVFYVKKRV